jgi:tripartite-type tricarboxylate transporter receptor subunit TctC
LRPSRRALFPTTLRPRCAAAPDLPTVAEQGIPGVAIDAWYGLLAPAHTSPEIIAQLTTALNEIVAEQDFRQHLQTLGYDTIDNKAQSLSMRIESDVRKYSGLKKRMGIKAAE